MTLFVSSFLTDDDFHSRTIETNWVLFKSKLFHLLATHIPKKKQQSKFNLPRINGCLSRMIGRKRHLYMLFEISGNEELWCRYKGIQKNVPERDSQAACKLLQTCSNKLTRREQPETFLPVHQSQAPRQWYPTDQAGRRIHIQ